MGGLCDGAVGRVVCGGAVVWGCVGCGSALWGKLYRESVCGSYFPAQCLQIFTEVLNMLLRNVPVDVLLRLFLWFSQAKHFECRYIHSPQEIQCVHMYSVA